MIRFIFASLITGLLFAIMDGLINGNALALKLMECYKPIARQSINVKTALTIDFIYGFVISGIFIFIMPVLPTEIIIIKGLIYGSGMWFFRVLMGTVSNWMMFNIPYKTLIYLLLTGLAEMVILGILNALIIPRENAL